MVMTVLHFSLSDCSSSYLPLVYVSIHVYMDCLWLGLGLFSVIE